MFWSYSKISLICDLQVGKIFKEHIQLSLGTEWNWILWFKLWPTLDFLVLSMFTGSERNEKLECGLVVPPLGEKKFCLLQGILWTAVESSLHFSSVSPLYTFLLWRSTRASMGLATSSHEEPLVGWGPQEHFLYTGKSWSQCPLLPNYPEVFVVIVIIN